MMEEPRMGMQGQGPQGPADGEKGLRVSGRGTRRWGSQGWGCRDGEHGDQPLGYLGMGMERCETWGPADGGPGDGAAGTGDPGMDGLGMGAREGPRVGVTWPQGPPRGRQCHLIAVLDADAAVNLVEQSRAKEGELLRRQLGHRVQPKIHQQLGDIEALGGVGGQR